MSSIEDAYCLELNTRFEKDRTIKNLSFPSPKLSSSYRKKINSISYQKNLDNIKEDVSKPFEGNIDQEVILDNYYFKNSSENIKQIFNLDNQENIHESYERENQINLQKDMQKQLKKSKKLSSPKIELLKRYAYEGNNSPDVKVKTLINQRVDFPRTSSISYKQNKNRIEINKNELPKKFENYIRINKERKIHEHQSFRSGKFLESKISEVF